MNAAIFPDPSKPPEVVAAEFTDEFLDLMKADSFRGYDYILRFLDQKYGDSPATEERKARFLRVASFIDQNLDALNHGMGLIAGKHAIALSSGLVLAVYMRLYMSKDTGVGATAKQVLDFYAKLEAHRPKG